MKQHRSIVVLAVMLLANPLAQARRADELTGRQEPEIPREEPIRITLRPMTIANAVDELAGQRVKVVNARVVGVFEPRAFLVEDATRYEAPLRLRDRVLVLIEDGNLHVSPEEIVGASVVIFGAARTLLGLRVSREAQWPEKLDRQLIERLEVRAGVLATTVQTPDGDLLGGSSLNRGSGSPGRGIRN